MEKTVLPKPPRWLPKTHLADLVFRGLVLGLIALLVATLVWAALTPASWATYAASVVAGLLLIPVLLVLPLRWINPPISALMIQKRLGLGGMMRPTGKLAHQWVTMDDMPPDLLLAAIVTEDVNFPLHFGLDFEAMHKAHEYNKTHEHKRGGSTITQQLAKNLFLWPETSYIRKVLELYFAFLMEGLWTKRRILEIYLNIVRLDVELFGVGAAAQQRLGKEVSALTRHEVVLIVSAIASPMRFQIAAPTPAVRMRQAMILARMKQFGEEYLRLI